MKKKKKGKKAPAWQAKAKMGRIPDMLAKAEENFSVNSISQAQQLYEKVLNIDPDNETALNRLAVIAVRLEQYDQARQHLDHATRTYPANNSYRNNLAQVHCCLKKWDEAIELSQTVLDRDSMNFFALSNMGIALKGKGNLEESVIFFRKMVDIQPGAMLPLTVLCELYNTLNRNDDLLVLLDKMELLLESLQSEKERIGLCFVLGRYYDYLDKFEEAFSWFKKGNDLKKQLVGGYDFQKDAGFIQQQVHNFDTDFVKKYQEYGIDNPSPIFIIGMPRSGTTLIEQILSRHSQVSAAGELDYMRQIAGTFDRSAPQSSIHLTARNYLHALSGHADGKKHVTDKMPHNFMFAGLIHTALPRATIIHCRRDPMDTCFSCYKQDFTGHHEYSYDLEDLGQFYLLYNEVMQHWMSAMPGVVHEIRYEEVVGDVKPQVQRILGFCGLEWEEQCLDFHRSVRKVRTSSWDQVSRPVYDTSIGRWKKYEHYLQPLYDTLKNLYS